MFIRDIITNEGYGIQEKATRFTWELYQDIKS